MISAPLGQLVVQVQQGRVIRVIRRQPVGQFGLLFRLVTLPKGTVIDGVDVSYYQFSPMFVNPSRFKGENFRDIPLLAEREVWLKKGLMNPDGTPMKDESGKDMKDIVKVMPAALKEAVDKGRAEFLASLDDKAKDAREASDNQTREARQAEPVAR